MASIDLALIGLQSRQRHRLGFFRAALLLGAVLLAISGVNAQQPNIPPVPPPPGKPDLPPLPAPPTSRVTVQPAFSVVIDPAHGGSDIGTRFADGSLEKDMTLALSARLRSALAARGMAVSTTRDADAELPTSQRAGIANHALASACLILHATASGSGVHLFTSSLPPAVAPGSGAGSALVPWPSAQAAWVTRSLRLASEVSSALGQAGIPVTLGVASVRPLDNLACPAVAIEIAPLAASAANAALPISDAKYQQRILDALASAMLAWSADWRQQP
jgi:N-acetylmuramoyl-L-alanine amidase